MVGQEKQAEKLPVTRSGAVTEDRKQILGLDGFSIFYVFMVFAGIAIFTDSFPFALLGSILTFTFFKLYLKGKPPHYLENIILFFFINKKFTHQTREKVDVFAGTDGPSTT